MIRPVSVDGSDVVRKPRASGDDPIEDILDGREGE